MGTSHPCPSLKYLSNKVRGMLCHCGSQNKYAELDAKLEKKMIEIKKSSSGYSNFKSIDNIILRFPQFKEGLKNVRSIFEQYDEDSNGIIDREELKKCLEEFQLHLKEDEIVDLFKSCDIDGSEGIRFNEFVVLLCLIHLLMIPSSSSETVPTNELNIYILLLLSPYVNSNERTLIVFLMALELFQMGSPQLKATFDAIVEVFLFLDKNGDGKLNKKDMTKTLNESYPWEKSPAHITRTRFKEMDLDRNGKVSFREFLFALISWIGIDNDEEVSEME